MFETFNIKIHKQNTPNHMHHNHHIWKPHLAKFLQNIVRNASEFDAPISLYVQKQQERAIAHGSQTFLIIIKGQDQDIWKWQRKGVERLKTRTFTQGDYDTVANEDKPDTVNAFGIFSRDCAEATNATGPIPHELFLFPYSEYPRIHHMTRENMKENWDCPI